MLSRFLLTLVFSWLVAPMWVAVAHWRGFGADASLQALLLTQGACVPFQLLLNECLAVGQVRSARAVSKSVIALVLSAQVLTCVSALMVFDAQVLVGAFTLGGFILACAVTNLVSYQVARVYYAAVLNGQLTHRESAWVGLVPGLSMLVLYTLFFEGRARAVIEVPGLLALLVPLAASLQWVFLERVCSKQRINGCADDMPAASLPMGHVAMVTATLMITSGLITRYRDLFSGMAPAYGALILVGLNTFSSAANTITRARFLTHGRRMHTRLGLIGAIAFGTAWLLGGLTSALWASLVALLGLQLLMIAAIEYARGLFAIGGAATSLQREVP